MASQMVEEEFRAALAARLTADLALLSGDADPMLQLFSRREDATLLGAAGGRTARGEAAAERLSWVASQSRGGTTAYEHLAIGGARLPRPSGRGADGSPGRGPLPQ